MKVKPHICISDSQILKYCKSIDLQEFESFCISMKKSNTTFIHLLYLKTEHESTDNGGKRLLIKTLISLLEKQEATAILILEDY